MCRAGRSIAGASGRATSGATDSRATAMSVRGAGPHPPRGRICRLSDAVSVAGASAAPHLFRAHPESFARIEPWLERELHVLLGEDEDIELVKEFVMSLMRMYVLAGNRRPPAAKRFGLTLRPAVPARANGSQLGPAVGRGDQRAAPFLLPSNGALCARARGVRAVPLRNAGLRSLRAVPRPTHPRMRSLRPDSHVQAGRRLTL